jgi:hypothetical protein
MAVDGGRTDPLRPLKAGQARSAAAQRRAMQALLAASVRALRSHDGRRAGRRAPTGSDL